MSGFTRWITTPNPPSKYNYDRYEAPDWTCEDCDISFTCRTPPADRKKETEPLLCTSCKRKRDKGAKLLLKAWEDIKKQEAMQETLDEPMDRSIFTPKDWKKPRPPFVEEWVESCRAIQPPKEADYDNLCSDYQCQRCHGDMNVPCFRDVPYGEFNTDQGYDSNDERWDCT